MLIERYLTNNERIGIDTNGFLIGDLSKISNETGLSHFDYSLSNYKKIDDIIDNPFSIIIGNGGLGKSTLLSQIENKLKLKNNIVYRLNLCTLVSETDLLNKIKDNLLKTSSIQNQYILLDAVDEAIDNNIRNPIELIVQTISKILKEYNNCKFIITSRTQVNNIQNLADQLYQVYSIDSKENNFIYQLCPLTQNDAINLAGNMGINNTDKFIEDINKLSLSSFLTSPITFKSVVDLYNDNKINAKTNHYKIFLELLKRLCVESSEYRKQLAADEIGKFKDYSSEELLIIASKLAIELKINKKTHISLIESLLDNDLNIENYINTTINCNNEKKYRIDRNILLNVLNSKLFYKTNNKYVFCQKTYFDFLCAYYLINIDINIRKFNKIFVFNNKVHPNFYDIVSLLAIYDNKFFKYYLEKSPEALIFSNILFNDDNCNKELFKKYIDITGNETYSNTNINTYDICRKLYYKTSIEFLKDILSKSKNDEIITLALDYIYINKLDGFDKELKIIIYNTQYTYRHKMFAIKIANENLTYRHIIDDIYINYDKINTFVKADLTNNLRAIVLEAMYPKYFSDEELLLNIAPIDNNFSWDWYHSYLRHEFLNEKYINKHNVLFFLKWVFNNELTGITRDLSSNSSFPDNIDRFFIKVGEFIDNKEIVDEIINYQINFYSKNYNCFSEYLFNKISKNNKIRLYALKRYIIISQTQNNIWFLSNNEIFKSQDIAYLMALYQNENNIDLKEKYENAINNYLCNNYWDNNEIKDFQYISNVFKAYPNLKEIFKRFNITTCYINNETNDAIDEFSINAKEYYLKQIENQKEHEKRKIQKEENQKYHNNISQRISEVIQKYKETNNIYYLNLIFAYLKHDIDNKQLYSTFCLDYSKTENWNKMDNTLKEEIVDVCISYLLSSDITITNQMLEKYIHQSELPCIWSCLGALLLKYNNREDKDYINILKRYKIPILYFPAHDDNDFKYKKQLINDLFKYEFVFIKEQIAYLLQTNLDCISLYTDIFESFELILDDFTKFLIEYYERNKKNICENAQIAIIKFLFSKNNYYAINLCLKEIKQNIKKDIINNKLILSYIKNLVEYFDIKYWYILTKLFYNNPAGVGIFKKIAQFLDYHNDQTSIIYNNLTNKDFAKLYIWLKKNIPEKHYNGIHEYKPEENVANRIYNHLINTGNYKCIKMIKSTMSKNAYKRSYNMAFNQYLTNKDIDYNKFKTFEKKQPLFFSFITIDRSITINNIKSSIIKHIGHNFIKKEK